MILDVLVVLVHNVLRFDVFDPSAAADSSQIFHSSLNQTLLGSNDLGWGLSYCVLGTMGEIGLKMGLNMVWNTDGK